MLQLVVGNSGVLQSMGAGKGYVEMSTVDADTVLQISEVKCIFFVNILYDSVSGKTDRH